MFLFVEEKSSAKSPTLQYAPIIPIPSMYYIVYLPTFAIMVNRPGPITLKRETPLQDGTSYTSYISYQLPIYRVIRLITPFKTGTWMSQVNA